MTLPSKIWYVSEGMFCGCTSLKEVKFTSYEASDSMVSLVQKNAFYGCSSLTSIEFPASLNILDYFDDGCLSGIFQDAVRSSDKRGDIVLHFHGIELSDIYEPLTSDVCYGKMYQMFTDDESATEQFKKIFEASKATATSLAVFISGCYRKADGTLLYSLVPNAAANDDTGWFIQYMQSDAGIEQLSHYRCIFVHFSYVLGTLSSDYTKAFYTSEQRRLKTI